MSRVEALERAVAASGASNWLGAYEALEDAWAVDKHPDLVEVGWAIANQRLGLEPIAERRERDTEAAWLAGKSNDALRLRLIATPWPRLTSDARARVDAIVAGAPALGWTAYLAALARSDPYKSNQSHLMLRAILRWLVKNDDAMAGRLIADLRAADSGPVLIDLGAVERRPLPRAEPLSERETALLDLVRRALSSKRSDIAALFRDVYANPFDDGRRAVLADALTETGDVRGEFISLQLTPSKKHARRVKELLRTHGTAWVGPLAPFIDVPPGAEGVFSRGFPSSVRLQVDQTPEIFGRTDAWGTVETLRVDHDFQFEFHPHLRGLRALLNVHDAGTTRIPALERLVTFADTPLSRLPLESVTELGFIADWGARAHLVGTIEFFARHALWFPTVKRLCVAGASRDLEFARELLERVKSIDAVVCSNALSGRNLQLPSAWELTLGRDERVTFDWHGQNLSNELPDMIASWLTPRRVVGLREVRIVETAKLSRGQRTRVIKSLREVAFDWPDSVSLTLFGEDGRS